MYFRILILFFTYQMLKSVIFFRLLLHFFVVIKCFNERKGLFLKRFLRFFYSPAILNVIILLLLPFLFSFYVIQIFRISLFPEGYIHTYRHLSAKYRFLMDNISRISAFYHSGRLLYTADYPNSGFEVYF